MPVLFSRAKSDHLCAKIFRDYCREMSPTLKTCGVSILLVFLIVYSTHAMFVSHVEVQSSESVSKVLEIPSFGLDGTSLSELSVCQTVFADSPLQIGPINIYPFTAVTSQIVENAQVYTCNNAELTELSECSDADVELICPGAFLRSGLVFDENGEPEQLTTHKASPTAAATAVMLRVKYLDVLKMDTPIISVELKHHQSSESSVQSQNDRETLSPLDTNPQAVIERDLTWSITWSGGNIGQPSGVEILDSEFFYLFHRGDRSWAMSTFKPGTDILADQTPLSTGPILKCRIYNGECEQTLGENLFLLPHGITLTPDKSHLMLTDVGSHQFVMMNAKTGEVKMTLGEFGVPGYGTPGDHFCKPTDAEMDPETGLIFVSDGYCNSRVAVFNNDGSYNQSFTDCFAKRMSIVHDLALDPQNRLLYVADREGQRLCVFSIAQHNFGTALKQAPMPGRFFAIDLDKNLNMITAEKEGFGNPPPYLGFGEKYSLGAEKVEKFADEKMNDPHDVSVSKDEIIFFTDLSAEEKVFKFHRTEL